MKIRINKKDLLKEFQITSIAGDNTDYIKSGTVLEARDNKLIVKTNGESVYVISKIDCEVIEEGRVNIKPDFIEPFIKQLDDEEVEINVEGTVLSVVTKSNIETTFSILEDVHISVPEIQIEESFKFDKEDIINKLEKIKFAVSTQSNQEHLNCIRFEIESGKMKLVATDSFRLAYLEDDYNSEIKSHLMVNIPIKTIDGLLKILRISDEKTLEVKSEGVRISFSIGDIQIYSKLVEKQFPLYSAIFKSLENPKEVTLSVNTFRNLLKRLQVFEKPENASTVIFDICKNNLSASINGTLSKFKEDLLVLYNDEDRIKLSLSVKYLLEFVNTIKDDNELIAKFDLNDRTPVVLYTKKGYKCYYFVMPTRI